jgi:hypothetical protein
VLSIWVLCRHGAYVGSNMTMITVFFVIILGIPTLIRLSWRHDSDPNAQGRAENYSNWTIHLFFDLIENLPSRAAAAQILLPSVAVASGMTIFGLMYFFSVP